MGALNNLKAGIPPKARLMLAVSGVVVIVGAAGVLNMITRDDDGPIEAQGIVDVSAPSERELPKAEVGETRSFQESAEMNRIIEEERRKKMQEALQSRDVSLTDSIHIPAGETAAPKQEAGMTVEGLRDVLEERREKERREREAARAAAAQNSSSPTADAPVVTPLFDMKALLLDELGRARGKDQPLENALSRLAQDASTARTQGEALHRGSGVTGAEANSATKGRQVVANDASSYASAFMKPTATANTAPNTVNERLARYRQAMGSAAGNPTAQLDEGTALQNLGGNEGTPLVAAASPSMQSSGGVVSSNGDGAPTRMIPAGKILYAVLDTEINSDDTQYIRATIVQEGPFKGATVLGQPQLRGDKVVLTFNRIGHRGKDYAVSAVAVDPETNRTALADSVDRHIIERYGLLWGAAFVEGFAEAMSNTSTVINSDGSTTSTRERLPDTSDQLIVATGKVGERTVPLLSQKFNRPPTIHVTSERPIGLMLLQGLPY